jgi:hypothetical protein
MLQRLAAMSLASVVTDANLENAGNLSHIANMLASQYLVFCNKSLKVMG